MHITRKRLRRATAGAFLYVQQFVRELEAFFEQMDREWYSDDPEWQKSHQDADSARAEQRAAKDYREKQEKTRQARDLSTQAAMDEKLAMRKVLDSNNVVTYNKNTGEYCKRLKS